MRCCMLAAAHAYGDSLLNTDYAVKYSNCRIHQNLDIHNSLLKISLALKFYHHDNVGLSVIGKHRIWA